MKGMELNFRVILSEPSYDGNIGSVCRAMKNFGFNELVLIRPCVMTDFAKAMASHAQDILASAITVDSFDEAIRGADLVIGSTGKPGVTYRNYLRKPYFSPEEIKEELCDKSGTVALVFGREDRGLANEELERCDMILYIPTSEEYPVMNLSHAVAVVLYELCGIEGGEFRMASREETEVMHECFEKLLCDINLNDYRREHAKVMFRRILGRAMLSEREFYVMMGVLRDTQLALQRISPDVSER